MHIQRCARIMCTQWFNETINIGHAIEWSMHSRVLVFSHHNIQICGLLVLDLLEKPTLMKVLYKN